MPGQPCFAKQEYENKEKKRREGGIKSEVRYRGCLYTAASQGQSPFIKAAP